MASLRWLLLFDGLKMLVYFRQSRFLSWNEKFDYGLFHLHALHGWTSRVTLLTLASCDSYSRSPNEMHFSGHIGMEGLGGFLNCFYLNKINRIEQPALENWSFTVVSNVVFLFFFFFFQFFLFPVGWLITPLAFPLYKQYGNKGLCGVGNTAKQLASSLFIYG